MKIKKILTTTLATLFVATAVSGLGMLKADPVSAEVAKAEWATGNSQVSVTMNYDILNSTYGPLGWRFHTENNVFKTCQAALAAEDFLYVSGVNTLKPMFYETVANAENPSINLGYYDGDFKTTSTPVQSVKAGLGQDALDYYGIIYTFTDTVTGKYFSVKMYSESHTTTRGNIAISVNGGEDQGATVFQGNFAGRFDSKTSSPFLGTLYLLNLKYDQDENKIKYNRDLAASFDLSAYGLTSAFETYKVDLSFIRLQPGKTAKLCVYYLNEYDLTATTDVNNLTSNGAAVYQKAATYSGANVPLTDIAGAWDTALGDVSAQATYTVKDAGGVDVAVADGKFVAPASGNYTVSATYGGETKNFTVAVTVPSVSYPEGGVIINKARLNLEGKIGVQFLVSADESLYDANGGKVVFTVAGETQEVAFKDWTKEGENYIVECQVAAKQMTDTITVKFVDKNGVVSAQTTYSVAEYANAILAGENETAKELVKATLNYGAYAQIYFNYNTENLANAGLYEAGQNPVELKTTVTAATATVSGEVDGVAMKSLALGLETETEVYVRFTLANGVAMSDVTFKVNGETAETMTDTNGCYIVIKNVAAKDVDTEYTVTATYGGNTATYIVSAQCYISAAFGATENVAYNNLLKAIELYNVAANAYFA